MNIIITGSGNAVYFLARRFVNRNYAITVITQDAGEAQTLSRKLDVTAVVGDASEPQFLGEAGARQADALIAMSAHDENNLIICQIAYKMFGVPRTIAVVNDPENEEVFRQLGVSSVFSATQMIATILEEQTGFAEIVNLAPVAEGRITVTEVTLPAQSPIIGKQLQEINLPQEALVACIIRDGNVIISRGSSYLFADDRLVLISQPSVQHEVLGLLCGESA